MSNKIEFPLKSLIDLIYNIFLYNTMLTRIFGRVGHGTAFDWKLKGGSLSGVRVRFGDVLDAIEIFVSKDGKDSQSDVYGGKNGQENGFSVPNFIKG
jgi:hypothetical protein